MWIAITSVTAAFLLTAGVITTLILAGRDTGVHAATALTVTTPITAGPSASAPADATGAPSSSTQHPPAHPTPPTPPASSTFSYRGTTMSAEIPVGWRITEREVQKPGYLESKWTNPANTADYLLIDMSPVTHLTPAEDAAPVHTGTEQTRGYREITYGPGDLLGVGSWMWVFEVPTSERIDYFFERCTNTFGVLGSTTPARFDRLRTTFREVAQSVQPACR
jgi:hypothetical protein